MKPEDFGFSITQRAYELWRAHIARFGHIPLDNKAAYWLVPERLRSRLRSEIKTPTSRPISPVEQWVLLDIPIRWAVDDPPGTPEIQLVMKTDLFAGKRD